MIFMEASFVFNQDYVKISDLVVDGETRNPYDTSFRIAVRSGDFAGVGNWECGIENLRDFVNNLEEMCQLHITQTELLDNAYGSYISFVMDRLGHLCVRGTLFGEHKAQHIEFEFTADQTVLRTFLEELRQLMP